MNYNVSFSLQFLSTITLHLRVGKPELPIHNTEVQKSNYTEQCPRTLFLLVNALENGDKLNSS